MRILIVTQYFWPESFRINDLCLGLKERGHEIVVLTGIPNYPKGKFYNGYNIFKKRVEDWNGIKIYRAILFPRRSGKGLSIALNYLSFPFFATFQMLFIKKKFDKIVVFQLSPVTSAIPAVFAKLIYKAPIYFWIQDLWPMSLVDGGGIKNKFVIAFFSKLTKVLYDQSYKILVQSKGFTDYINKQGVNVDKICYFPNSAESFYQILPIPNKYTNKFPEGFNLIFAGNIGEAQSFKTLIETAQIIKNTGIQINWIILGDGRMKNEIQKKIEILNLNDTFYFLGSFSANEMPLFFANADALIVSLKKSQIFSLTIPSKIQSYLACGKPIIGTLDGSGASIIEEALAGFTSPAENSILLAEAIFKLLHSSLEERKQFGMNGRKYFEQEFEREILLDKLESILYGDETIYHD
ncbi:MAG: glycosyltransferase family 4 protein [Sediminibacterium sp.]|nr:glycosyltransferase family 4 protein [Sediminibacterium sp.]